MSTAVLLKLLVTHALATAGGWVASLLGIPLPWTIGSLLVVAAACLAGLPMRTERRLRNGGTLVMLLAIGLTFTPAAARATLGAFPLMLFAAIGSLVVSIGLAFVLAWSARIDRTTAYFCAVPGGPAEMGELGERQGADVAMIGMAQLLRIVLLVLTIPPILTFGGFVDRNVSSATPGAVDLPGLAITLAATLALTALVRRTGFQASFILVPLAIGMLLGLTQWQLSAVPAWLMNTAQVVMGAYLGAQFSPDRMRAMRRFVGAAVLNVALLAFACAGIALLLAGTSDLPAATFVLATAPGSVAEMALTAKALHLDVPLITAFHILRIFIIALLTPFAFALLQRFGLTDDGALTQGNPAE
jgi:membrane AbrB-like protein